MPNQTEDTLVMKTQPSLLTLGIFHTALISWHSFHENWDCLQQVKILSSRSADVQFVTCCRGLSKVLCPFAENQLCGKCFMLRSQNHNYLKTWGSYTLFSFQWGTPKFLQTLLISTFFAVILALNSFCMLSLALESTWHVEISKTNNFHLLRM